jgi:hypothetical protein
MSFFKNLFGGKKEPPAPSTSESIQKLRDTENMLLKKQEFLEQKVMDEQEIAKKNASTNKRGELSISTLYLALNSNDLRDFPTLLQRKYTSLLLCLG